MDQQNNVIDYTQFPNERGHFGIHGGRFVSETLMAALEDLEKLYFRMKDDAQFLAEFDRDLAYYVGRPSPLYYAERWSKELGGAQIYLKREDLNHMAHTKLITPLVKLYWLNCPIKNASLPKLVQVSTALPLQPLLRV